MPEVRSNESAENRYAARREYTLRQDRQWSAEQLEEKYNPNGDGRHPIFGEQEWMQEVLNRQTLRGYWDWVAAEIEEEFREEEFKAKALTHLNKE